MNGVISRGAPENGQSVSPDVKQGRLHTALPAPNQPRSQEVCSFLVSQPWTLETILKHEVIEFRNFLEEVTEDEEASVDLPVLAVVLFLITRMSSRNDTGIDGRRSGRRVRIRCKALDRWVGDTIEVSETIRDKGIISTLILKKLHCSCPDWSPGRESPQTEVISLREGLGPPTPKMFFVSWSFLSTVERESPARRKTP
jgi:hypothetical protein